MPATLKAPAMRLAVLIPLFLCATPLVAQTVAETDMLPAFSHDEAMTCLALWVTNLEREGAGLDPAGFAKEMVFFSRLIAQKATPEEAANFDTRFAEEVDLIRSWQAALDNPATREEADMDLTGTGKMCWFQALAAEGGPYEGQ
jgi:hypothetical protein